MSFNSLQLNQPSLFIQWVERDVTPEQIASVINEVQLGTIERIDMKGNVVYVHFTEWNRNDMADQVRKKLIENENNFIKLHYEPTKYWKIFANKLVPIFRPTITFGREDRPPNVKKNAPKYVPTNTSANTQVRKRFVPESKSVPTNVSNRKWMDDNTDDES